MEVNLISSHPSHEPLITEVSLEEITSNISENTNFQSRLKMKKCSCIPCPDGPYKGQSRCGKNGKCTKCRCPGGLPKPTSPPDDIL